jgi:hypothetical protein
MTVSGATECGIFEGVPQREKQKSNVLIVIQRDNPVTIVTYGFKE